MSLVTASLNPASPQRRLWLPAVLALLAACVVAGAGWWGHHTKLAALDATMQAPAPRSPSPAASRPAGAGEAARNPGMAEASPPTPKRATSTTAPSAATAASPELKWPLWEFRLRDPVPPRVPSLTPPTWRLIGATLSTGTWSVMVLQQGKTTPDFFTVGQELPGGFRIEHIDDEAVTLVQNKRKLLLSYINAR